MSRRLQVLLEDDELREIQALAKGRRQTTATFVREALRDARIAAQYPPADTRLRAIREAAEAYAYPVGELEEMLADIERGYLLDA